MPRPKRAPGVLPPRVAEMMALADGTRTRHEVAAAMGCKYRAVTVMSCFARDCGHDPRFVDLPRGGARPNTGRRESKPGKARTVRPPKLPRIRLDLPPDVTRWFIAQIPQGGTADDLVRGFIIDAFNEEVGQ